MSCLSECDLYKTGKIRRSLNKADQSIDTIYFTGARAVPVLKGFKKIFSKHFMEDGLWIASTVFRKNDGPAHINTSRSNMAAQQ